MFKNGDEIITMWKRISKSTLIHNSTSSCNIVCFIFAPQVIVQSNMGVSTSKLFAIDSGKRMHHSLIIDSVLKRLPKN